MSISLIGRLRQRLWHGRRSSRRTLVIAGAVCGLVLIGGGGVYAALGGVSRTQDASDIELQRGLVGWWKMDGNAKDATPNANNGTLTNASLTADRESASNSAYSFTGSSSYMSAGNSTLFDMVGDVTISAWIKPGASNQSNIARLVSKVTSGGGANYSLHFDSTTGTKVRFVIDTNIATYTATTTTTFTDTTKWYHIVGERSGGTLGIYVNGVLEGTSLSVSGTGTTNTANLTVAGRGIPTYFNGSIDDVRLYNRALSAAEISVLANQYNAGLRVDSGASGIVGQWKFDGNAKDATPNANDGTVTGASLAPDREAKANAAYSFSSTAQISYSQTPQLSPASQISLDLWMKTTAIAGTTGQTILSNKESGGYALLITGSSTLNGCPINSLCYIQYIAGTGQVISIAKSAITDGTWYHLVATYDGAAMKLYLNNTVVASGSFSGALTNTTATVLCIGSEAAASDCTSAALHYRGSLDDVRVYNRALSASEIAAQYGSYNAVVAINDVQKGLILDMPLNGSAKDATPYADNASVTGASLVADRKGRSAGAYSFDGSSAYLSAPTNTIFDASTFTIAAWIYPTANTAAAAVARYTSSAGPDGWYIGNSATANNFTFQARINTINYSLTSGTGYGLNAWHHVIGTYNGATMTLYIDGTLATSGAASGSIIANSQTVRVGSSSAGTLFWPGSVDDVKVWNRALSALEAVSVYAQYR